MNIEITGETEKLIQAAIAAGRYTSAEEFIADMIRRSKSGMSPDVALALPKHLDLDSLAVQQGVGPIKDFRDLEADFFPASESVDEFVNEIRALRDADEPRSR